MCRPELSAPNGWARRKIAMKGSAKIMVFDPDAESAGRVALCLAEVGYEVARFETLEQMVTAVKRWPADIVLLDLGVEEIRGMELIREAKRSNPEVSVILTGALSAVEKNPHMLMFAGYEYVLKPIHNELLCSIVEQRLNQQHLYRICSALSASLDLGGVLDVLLETTLREVGADQIVVFLKDEETGDLKIEAAKGMSRESVGRSFKLDDDSIVGLVLGHNEPVVLQGGFAPAHLFGLAAGAASSIYAPIRLGGKTIGLLNVNRLNHSAPFRQSNLRTVEIVALQTAVAIQNAREYRHALERQKMQNELELARSIQQSLFPKTAGFEQYAEIESHCIPARMIGGDFYDFIELGSRSFGVVIGDVAGKGVPGALLMMRAVSKFRLRARPGKDPGEVLCQLNNGLLESSARGMYVTGIYAVFDLERSIVRFANAGHPPPLFRRRSCNEVVSPDESGGVPLGILRDYRYETAEIEFAPGDLALFYTDGVIEARNPAEEEFSVHRLKRLLQNGVSSSRMLSELLLSEIRSFTACRPQHDDLTLLTVAGKPSN